LDVARALDPVRAAGVEDTPARQVVEIRDIEAAELELLLGSGDIRVGLRDGGGKGPGVGVKATGDDARCRALLDLLADVHDAYLAFPRKVLHHGEEIGR